MRKNLFFDFDGTIADTLSIAMEFFKTEGPRFGMTPIGVDEFKKLTTKEALAVMGLKPDRLNELVAELKTYIQDRVQTISVFQGLPTVLESLQCQGFHLFILSSNAENNIRAVLQTHHLLNAFEGIFSDSGVYSKDQALLEIFKTQNISAQQSIYIGDEARDLEACRKLSIPMVAVSWGWDDVSKLTGCQALARTPAELEIAIHSISS